MDNLTVLDSYDKIDSIVAPIANPHLFGHENIVHFLQDLAQNGRMPHALLFEGESGIGKATAAFRLAWNMVEYGKPTMNAPDVNGPHWRQMVSGSHPAIMVVSRSKDSKTGRFRAQITVDEIRRITHFLGQTAHDGQWRVVIIDSADDMNRNAANALLKTLEEPGKNILFILISHSAASLLPTIRSRCQVLNFRPLEHETLIKVLQTIGSNIGFDAQAYQDSSLFELARGSARRAFLMIAYGGLEIISTTQTIIEADYFDVDLAHKLATTLSAREAIVQYDLFVEYLLTSLLDKANDFAAQNKLDKANAWANFYQNLEHEISQSDEYNLDKKTSILIWLEKIQRAYHTMG